ncbi:MAG: hypothetical protein E7627_09495 [Ruminococcaceae bacterium]|nr:hypothetical protein [Oscillospiraceae bacterium]
MIEKLKKLVKSTKFFIAVYAVIFLGLIVLFTWPLPYIWVVNSFLYIKGVTTLYWRFFLLVAAFVAVLFVIPFLMFVVRRIFTYLRLWLACLRKGVDFKLLRFPFASLGGIKEKGDILITTPREAYVIHFADVVHRFRSIISVANGREYVITKVGAGKILSSGSVRFVGGPRGIRSQNTFSRSGYSLDGKDKSFILPETFDNAKHVHVMMLHTRPVDAVKVQGTTKSNLTNGDTVGNMVFFYPGAFIKSLNDRQNNY